MNAQRTARVYSMHEQNRTKANSSGNKPHLLLTLEVCPRYDRAVTLG
jgi:hypothetical protein